MRGTTRLYGAKTATAGAYITQNHEGRSTLTPAFADIGALGALAHRIKAQIGDETLYIYIIGMPRCFGLKPGRQSFAMRISWHKCRVTNVLRAMRLV